MRKLHTMCLLCCAFVFWPVTAAAYDEERAMLNLSADMAECAAFYSTLSIIGDMSEETLEKYESAAFISFTLAASITNEEATKARMQMSMESMADDLDGDRGNVSILLNKYSKLCKSIHEDVEARLQYWLDKKD